jgi:AcrR family transcriptional regulator
MSAIHPPKQRRSHATLTRLLQAAQELLEERPFSDVSVSDIVERAGSSVGAFYARFEDKQALLESLREAFERDTAGQSRDLLTSRDGDAAPLDSVIRGFVGMLIRQHRAHRGTLRALVGQSIAGHGRAGAERELISTRLLIELIRSRRGEIAHPDPDVAVHLGLGMVLSAIRDRVLFPELSGDYRPMSPVTDAVFAEELTRALAGLLAVKPR